MIMSAAAAPPRPTLVTHWYVLGANRMKESQGADRKLRVSRELLENEAIL